MVSEYILDVVDVITKFGSLFGTFLFSTLGESLLVLERMFDWFNPNWVLVVMDSLAPELTAWLLNTPVITIVLGSGVIFYAVFTIVKYIVDIVL